MGVSRHGEFWPFGIMHVGHGKIIFLWGSVDCDWGFAPMAHGQTFENIMINLRTRGSITRAVIAILKTVQIITCNL